MKGMEAIFWSRVTLITVIGILGFLAWQTPALSGSSSKSENLTVTFLDVGQGDAIHIETPDGFEMLIDGGATSQVLRELSAGRNFFDRSIDVVMATHPDTDHIGGLVDVLQRYTVETVIQTNAVNETPASNAIALAISSEQAQTVTVQRGDVIQLGASTTVRVLSPLGDTSAWQSNTASIVVQVKYGDIEFMLTGDAPVGIEEYIAQYYGEMIESEVLKLGHHGSNTSTSEEFLALVQPQFAVVSAGADNRYGHPHSEVVQRVVEQGIELVSTAETGSVIFESDGNTVWLVN